MSLPAYQQEILSAKLRPQKKLWQAQEKIE
jgi:hypothetical protein